MQECAQEVVMLDGAVNEIGCENGDAYASAHGDERAASYALEWQTVHAKLRALAHQRVELEAEEGTYLLEAEDLHVFRRLGYRSMVEYMVGELDFTRHAANERLRVTRELLTLPKLAAAHRSGELCFSKVRELSRVVTPATEEAFLAAARGRDSHQVAKMVSGLTRGDLPDTPPDPALVTRRVVFELHPEALGLLASRTKALKARLGREPTHDEVIIELCTSTDDLDPTGDRTPREAELGPTGDRSTGSGERGPTGDRSTGESACACAGDAVEDGTRASASAARLVPWPRSQQLVLTCKHCERSELVVDGEALAIDDATAARLLCDTEVIGDAETDDRSRVASKIPAALRRKVFSRDRFRCVVPGCTARRHLDIHHLQHLEDGGQHTMANLCVLCFHHHKQHHDGALDITGTAPHRLAFHWRCDDEDAEDRSPWDAAN